MPDSNFSGGFLPLKAMLSPDGNYVMAVGARNIAQKGSLYSVNIGTGGGQIIAANNNRVALYIYNNGSATLYLSGGAATAGGIPLAAASGWWDIFSYDAWFGLSASGTLEVRLLEYVLPIS